MVKALCNLADGYQAFEGIYISIYQNKDDNQMETESSSKCWYQPTKIPQSLTS